MLHIYWGLGKGKTSATNGAAVRAKGAGLNAIIFRFLKSSGSSENKVLESIGVKVITSQEIRKFVINMSPLEKLKAKDNAFQTLKMAKLNARNYDMIILDEFLDLAANNVNFFTENQLLEFINELPNDKEILVTGHTKIPAIFDKADLITKMQPQKHYFEKGIKARKGIEF